MIPGTVITQLLGGLGNQMFQYAVGRRIAHDRGLELRVDDSILIDHSPGRHAVNRHYDLDIFNLQVEKATIRQRWRFNPHGLSVPLKIAFRLRRAMLGEAAYHEKSFRFDRKLVESDHPPKYLSGQWQSYKYFESLGDLIRHDFSFRDPLPPVLADLAGAIRHPASVCLNVRRTDYVTTASTSSILGFVGLDYYKEAVKTLNSTLGSSVRFFVFSDDIEWCRSGLRWLNNDPVFVEHSFPNQESSSYFQFMSLASNFILSNSTFAWWAAWLSQCADKQVVAPKGWFRDPKIDTSDLCPPSWVRL